jgi:hypothetical protein
MSIASNASTANAAWLTSVRWWLKDPLNPSANMELSMQPGNMETSASDPQQIVFAVGRVTPIVMSDVIKMPTITALPLRFLTDASYQAFEALRATGHTLLLQAPKEVGQWYVRLGDTKNDSLNLRSMRQWTVGGDIIRDVTISAQVVAAP